MFSFIGTCTFAEITPCETSGIEQFGGGGPGKGNRQTYKPGGRTYQPKPFYSRRKAPKSKSHKSMPSTTKHIG